MNEKTRILYVIGAGEYGGAEQYVYDLVTSLPDEWNPHVAVAYDAKLAKRLRETGINVTVAPSLPQLKKLIERLQPAIIHTHGVRSNVFARISNVLAGRKSVVITTVHSVLKHDYTNPVKRLLFSTFEKMTRSLTDRYIAVSKAIQDNLIEEGWKKESIRVVYNGIRDQNPQPEPSLRAELNLCDQALLIGTVARLHAVKGHRYLLDAIEKLREHKQWHFVWIGDGELRSELQANIRQRGLENQVHLLGKKDHVLNLIMQMDLTVVPSVMEGFGLVALESMFCGVPVVATQAGGLPELIAHGKTGYLVPPQNPDALSLAIETALADRNRLREMGKTARETVRNNFLLEHFVQKTVNLYKQELARR